MKGRVSISVNGRKFGLGCEDGEEERLMRLGQKLDDRVNDMANQFGQIGDLRLLVMVSRTKSMLVLAMSEKRAKQLCKTQKNQSLWL